MSSEFWRNFLPAGKDFTIPAHNFLPAGIPFLELPKRGQSVRRFPRFGGFHPGNRNAVLKEWKNEEGKLLERLPLNYDDTTLRTIEQIDILWLRSRSIVRAFEVEHTTKVYSGILRMADLLALQPNMDIKPHIVAPAAKRDKVFQEIRRPVFSLLEKGPLAENCTYLSYDSLHELAAQKHLTHMSDSVLDEYAEEAE